MNFTKITDVTKPRKAKRCYWCDERCEIGQPRVVVSGLCEGDFFADHHHLECHEAWSKWWDGNPLEYEPPEEGSMKRGTIEVKEEFK